MPSVSDIDRFAFVVGAPRSGTTSLAHFLKSHPDVCFPIVKEPHFFAQHDLRGLDDAKLKQKVEAEYLARFHPHHSRGTPVAADCSVSYLYTPEQLTPAVKLWPESRFVVILRDPLEMLPSLHKRLLFLGDETLTDFAEAWAASPDRAAGRRVPRSCADPRWLRYDQACRYGAFVERLFEAVGRQRCLVLLFDDLVASPATQYRRLMDFLGLPPCERVDFAPRRKSHDVRHLWLQRMLQRPPKAVRKYLAGPRHRSRARKLDGDLADSPLIDKLFALRKRVLRWNRLPPRKDALPIALRNEIRTSLRDDIRHLESLIGRELSHWLGVRDLEAHQRPVRSHTLAGSLEPANA